MKRKIVLVFVFMLVALAGVAQNVTPRVDARERTERARIHEGRVNGDLTKREAAGLNRQQRHFRKTERRAKADGTVSHAEKRKLYREQNRASRNIRKQKHDGQARKAS